MVFDLDPGEGIAPEFVRETALALRDFLDGEGFESWAKTSGGKGLHVMVPIARVWDWARVRGWAKRTAERFAMRDERYTTSSKLVDRSPGMFARSSPSAARRF